MRLKDFNWYSGLFVIIYHILFFAALPFYLYNFGLPEWGMLLSTLLLYLFVGLGVTAGYHRLYSHRSYATNKFVDFVLLFLGTLAAEGSALRWSADHRVHHRFVDTDKDPYSIKKGFLYAHLLWIFEKQQPIDEKVVQDLLQNRLVVLQNKYYTSLFVFSNLSVLAFFGIMFKDFLGALVFCILGRIFLIHHTTWFINSLAHTWGSRTYSSEESAVDNYAVSLLTLGEGYHNYHHTFASDYRNGVRWYHFDPTKWLVWTLEKLGLAKKLIRVNNHTIQNRLAQEDKNQALEKIRKMVNREALEAKINQLYEIIQQRISVIRTLKEDFTSAGREKQAELKARIRVNKSLLSKEWKNWCSLINNIMNSRIPA